MPQFSNDELAEVLQLEWRRLEGRYRPGWLYYECKKKGLLPQLKYLRSIGKVAPAEFRTSPGHTSDELLTIELVPETCWFSNVRSNVSEEDWNKLRQETASAAGHRCEICGGRGAKWPVECHEKWEYDESMAIQKLTGLISLCPACHEVKHVGLANIRGRKQDALEHLAWVNGWTIDQATSYADEQYEVWLQRSAKDWKLDVDWLTTKGIKVKELDRKPIIQEENDQTFDTVYVQRGEATESISMLSALKLALGLGLLALLIRILVIGI